MIANQGYHELEPLGRMIKSMVNITPTEKTETNPMPHVKTQASLSHGWSTTKPRLILTVADAVQLAHSCHAPHVSGPSFHE